VELYLVRHAFAGHADSARWPDDTQRPVTEEGAARFRSAARGLAAVVPDVERVLSSPWVRAWQTAEILQEESGWPAPQLCPEVSGDRSPAEGVELLADIEAASLAFVGHEPHLSSLASQLLTGDPGRLALEMKKGGVAFLELEDGPAVLRWSVSPKILRRLARAD
jgi:phosphohistidine phosphatase